MFTKRALLAGMAATGFSLAAARPASAQTYPTRPVKMVVPLPAGSAPDVRHRLIAQALTQLWGQQVIVENRPGGGGIIGTRAVLGEQPDGYTLLAALASIYMILPAQQENLPFDVNRDMIPIGLTAYEGLVMACSPKLGVNSLAEFIALAKKMPDKLVIGTNPAGSLPHITAKLFVDLTNTGITVVPYSTGGTADAIRDILGGRVHAVIDGWASLRGGIEFEGPHPACDSVAETVGSASRPAGCSRHRSRLHLDRLAGAHRALGDAGADRACPGRQPAQGSRRSAAAEATSGNRPSVPATLRRRVDALHRGRAEVLAAARQEIRDLSRPSGNMVGGFALVAFPLGLQLSRPATATPGVAHPDLELPWARQ